MYETKICDIDNLQTWFHFDKDIIHTAIDQWRDHLRSCVCASGGHFEHMI